MKALSVRQPFAWAIVAGHKPIENRSWNVRYRGELLLHASQNQRDTDEETMRRVEERAGATVEEMYFGGIIGRFRIVAVIPPHPDGASMSTTGSTMNLDRICKKRWAKEQTGIDFTDEQIEWWIPNHYGWVLADVVALPFVRFKGAVSFFEVPDSLIQQGESK